MCVNVSVRECMYVCMYVCMCVYLDLQFMNYDFLINLFHQFYFEEKYNLYTILFYFEW